MNQAVAHIARLCLGLCLGIATHAQAIALNFVPAQQTVVVGGPPAAVDIVISGLGRPPSAGGFDSVGAFDLDVSFDAMLLMPVDVVFGPALGNPSLGEALTAVAFAPGLVDLAVVSLLASADLDRLQPATFLLATLFFATTGAGVSPLVFSQAIVDDASVLALKLSVDAGTGAITVVPEPSTLALLGSALAAFAALHRGRRVLFPGGGIRLATLPLMLLALVLCGPAQAAFKKVDMDANPASKLEYDIGYEFQFKDNNTNQIWKTTVVVKNTDAANAQKVMLCLQGVTHPLKTATAPRSLVNVSYNNAAKRMQCAPEAASVAMKNRYGNLGCQEMTIPKAGMSTFIFVAGQRPNPDQPAAFAVQDGIYRNKMNGAGLNGPGHRIATSSNFLLGAKTVRIVRQAIDELRLHFVVLNDATIEMACRSGFAAAEADPAHTAACAAANQSMGPPACNLGFGMNFEFALPGKPIKGVTIHKEAVKWNPGDLKLPNVTLSQLDIPFGVESAVVLDDSALPFTAYLRVTLPSGFPPSNISVVPPENTYFTVFPGSGQYGALAVHSLSSDFSGAFVITVRKALSIFVAPADRDIQADEVVVENLIPIASSELCDFNRDRRVDIRDINESFAYRGLPATVPDKYDLDANATITVNDARICAQKCTSAKCAE